MIPRRVERNFQRVRVTQKQIGILVDAVEKNPFLNRTNTPNYSNEQRTRDWVALSITLNQDGGGAVKSVEKWQKCWIDFKTEVKKRYFGQTNCKRMLSSLEERTAVLMGLEGAKEAFPARPPLELEISKVQSIKDMPTADDEPTKPETLNLITFIPDESRPITIIRVKVDPENISSGPLEDNESQSPQSETVTFGPVANNITAVPKETLVPKFNPVSKETSVLEFIPVPKETSEPEITSASEETSEPEISPISKKRKMVRTKVKTEDHTGDLVKAQLATAEALKSVAKALETMAENQKAQVAIEERRTVLFEKLINHFCT